MAVGAGSGAQRKMAKPDAKRVRYAEPYAEQAAAVNDGELNQRRTRESKYSTRAELGRAFRDRRAEGLRGACVMRHSADRAPQGRLAVSTTSTAWLSPKSGATLELRTAIDAPPLLPHTSKNGKQNSCKVR